LQAIQPALLQHDTSYLQALCRSRTGGILETQSKNGGKTWGPLRTLDLVSSNSALDVLHLTSKRQLLVYNNCPTRRTSLAVAMQYNRKPWQVVMTIETGKKEYSYPSIIQVKDEIHIVYSYNQHALKHYIIPIQHFL